MDLDGALIHSLEYILYMQTSEISSRYLESIKSHALHPYIDSTAGHSPKPLKDVVSISTCGSSATAFTTTLATGLLLSHSYHHTGEKRSPGWQKKNGREGSIHVHVHVYMMIPSGTVFVSFLAIGKV